MKTKTKLNNLEMTGKIISISEEKETSNLNILLDNKNIEIKVNKKDYGLGDKLGIEVNLEVNKIKKDSK